MILDLYNGDSLDILKDKMRSNYFDAIITDPPYGLKFMGKKWDYEVPSVEIWKEALRVLKPGGHLLSFGGTRTYHRMVVNIEDAGFEIRDQIQWLYGSGFPKSHDVSKGIDKQAGVERTEVLCKKPTFREPQSPNGWDCTKRAEFETAPATPDAIKYQGWGTALKPANEPICLARKPLEKGLTVAQNVLKWGTGAINIDGSRIGTDKIKVTVNDNMQGGNYGATKPGKTIAVTEHVGRWPANIILDEEAAQMLDEQSGPLNYATKPNANKGGDGSIFGIGGNHGNPNSSCYGKNKSGASRFFYCAKASKSERNAGLENEIKSKQGARPNSADSSGKFPDHDHRETGGNNHPTVKPVKLMEYLVKLITPVNGVVLDPFMGSGTTGVACKNLGFNFFGVEMNSEYFEIAKSRIEKN